MNNVGERVSKLDAALKYAKEGWPVLPLIGKEPLTDHGYKDASCDEAQIKKWWKLNPDANIGIVAGDRSGLLVLDIDIKKGHHGDESLRKLEEQYGVLPKTLKAQTVSGGWHFVFRMPALEIKSNKGVRDGIDVLANGSYFVAPPSTIDGKSYQWVDRYEIALCPDWLATLTKTKRVVQETAVNPRIAELIRELFPNGRESNGNWITRCPYHNDSKPSFAIRLDDGRFICYAGDCAEQGSFVKLYAKMKNVSEQEARRILVPIPPFIEELNRKHAIVKLGGKVAILTEQPHSTENWKEISFSSETHFTLQYRNRPVRVGDKKVSIAKLWLSHPARRTYCGADNVPPPESLRKDYYNFWQGFAVEPKPGDCGLYLQHIYENICQQNEALNRYVLCWLAQAVQEPALRKGTALVLRGKQGTGKGCMITEFGKLWGPHFFHAHDPRQLTGKFNGHLRHISILFADEAFWAGNKHDQGPLKALVTEDWLPIEFKGQDVIQVRNYVRVMMATNNDWSVPAGLEERRFLVMQVGDAHMNDEPYFEAIRKQMNNGGRAALLDYLLKYDWKQVNLRKILQTDALIENKLLSFDTPRQFWYEILQRRTVLEGDSIWTPRINKERLYLAYLGFAKEERWKGTQTAFWISIKKLCPHGRDVTVNGNRCWEVGSWERCKDAFDRALQWQNHIWDAPEVGTPIPPARTPSPPSEPTQFKDYDSWDRFKTDDESEGGAAATSV